MLVCIPEYVQAKHRREREEQENEKLEQLNTCALTGNSWTAHKLEDRELSLNSALQKLYFLYMEMLS